jgi:hypothetical protein
MVSLLLTCVLLAPPEGEGDDVQTLKTAKAVVSEYLRESYHADAAKYVFHHDDAGQQPLKLVEKPIMRWANDDDWSGDVYVWTHAGRPEVVGCMLSGPSGEANRNVFHEFHLLAKDPIGPADLLTKRRWMPKQGLELITVADAPEPAKTSAGRLLQMRQISRKFTAHMEADGRWELRLLPQPLFRYGDDKSEVVDGALFCYVWTKGTDPEVMLLLECRKIEGKLTWQFAPVRFSNRQVWLEYDGQEMWRAESHREPAGNATDLVYTTAYARTMPRQPPETNEKAKV